MSDLEADDDVGDRTSAPAHAARTDVPGDVPGDVPSDETLARRAALGDRDAFAAVVDRHGPALHRYAYRLLDDPGDVDDCVQDVFLSAWKGLPSFRGDSSLRTWLFTITRHAVYARSRRWPASGSRPHVDLDDVVDRVRDLRADPERESVEVALREALDLALQLLPPRQRAAWLLREVEELRYDEIARVLGTTTTSVRGLLERGRTTLAQALEEWR